MSQLQPSQRGGQGRGRGRGRGRGGTSRGQGGNRGRGSTSRGRGNHREEGHTPGGGLAPGRGGTGGRGSHAVVGDRGGCGGRGISRPMCPSRRRDIMEGLEMTDELLTIPSTPHGDLITIENIHYIGSYNWTDEREPTVIVPGR